MDESEDMDKITILVGTMTGTAEMVADEVEAALSARGFDVTVRPMDDLDVHALDDAGTVLICSSTYGQGDVPDNARDFLASVEAAAPDLSDLRYGVIALGDRTYSQTYCFGGLMFDTVFSKLGAHRIGEPLCHDASSGVMAEDAAVAWAGDWADLLDERRAAA